MSFIVIFPYMYIMYFFLVMGTELRASCLLSRGSISCTTPVPEVSQLDVNLLFNSCSYFLSYWSPIQKVIAYIYVFSMFSCSCFKVSGSTLRPLLHFELVCTEWEIGPSFCVLHVDIQFLQHHLLNRLSFLQFF
jgi:hypothetical protein